MNSRKLASKVVSAISRPSVRSMSSTANVWIDKNTRVICQGFTGKQVRKEWLECFKNCEGFKKLCFVAIDGAVFC